MKKTAHLSKNVSKVVPEKKQEIADSLGQIKDERTRSIFRMLRIVF